MEDYTRWTSHGEEAEVDDGLDDEARHEESTEEDMAESEDFVYDAEEPMLDSDDLAKMVNDPHVQEQVLKDTENSKSVTESGPSCRRW
jgi:hypothetical protein